MIKQVPQEIPSCGLFKIQAYLKKRGFMSNNTATINTKLDVVLFNALPFNILKGLVIGAITMIIYKKLTSILKGATLK